jgi:16S rRNA (guanine527-N7)-methyltransferase
MSELLKKYLSELDIEFSDFQIEQFETYKNFLLEWNQKFNLISKNDEPKIELHHFFDSLAISKYLTDKNKGFDVGSGAGFPAIPLKILNPHIEYTLAESIGKKAKFLDALVKKLNLENVTIINDRAENLSKKSEYAAKFDFATVRAVATLDKLIDLCLPFLKKNAILYAHKSEHITEEVESISKKNISKLDIISYQLPTTSIIRKIVMIQKK